MAKPIYFSEHRILDGYQRIRRLRAAAGISQADMAHRMGVPLRLYEELEANGTAVLDVHLNAAQRVAGLKA